MKKVKIILGILVLISAFREYIRAEREVAGFNFDILFFGASILVAIGVWLTGSGIYSTFSLKSREFLLTTAGILASMFLVGFFIFKGEPKHIIESNGFKIAIDDCLKGNSEVLKDEKERRDYCACLAAKITSDNKLVGQYTAKLKQGNIDWIMDDLMKNDRIGELELEKCLTSASSLRWTSLMVEGMRTKCIENLSGSDFSNTNNIYIYCNCRVTGLQEYPAGEVNREAFFNSAGNRRMDSICILESLKK